jgi:predicted choloylglycine hydrolase
MSQVQPPIHSVLIFQNLNDLDEFATYVVTMEGPVERPIEIRTSAIVLDFFLTRAPFAVSLQDAMAIILERNQDQTFSAPAKWATFINRGKAQLRKLWWNFRWAPF